MHRQHSVMSCAAQAQQVGIGLAHHSIVRHCSRQAGRRWQQADRHLFSRANSHGWHAQEDSAEAWASHIRRRSIKR